MTFHVMIIPTLNCPSNCKYCWGSENKKEMMGIEIIDNYTNISFTEKQKEDVPKLYDAIYSSGLKDAVMKAIPEAEWI